VGILQWDIPVPKPSRSAPGANECGVIDFYIVHMRSQACILIRIGSQVFRFLIGDRAPHAQREESRLTGEVRIDDLGTVLIREHNFLSTDLVISGLKMLSKARIMTQSELLGPLASILRFGSPARASSSVRAMRTSRQSMCSHAELASFSIMHRMHAAVG